jgi:2-polyprenyl-6-methoxyphenol hydroxylase-like FAD-dependent oxidoreductase
MEPDVLIVGAGPTGLALALELRRQGVSFRIIDQAPDAVHESRALGVQARTLEVLDRLGVADDLVRAGNPTTEFVMHAVDRDQVLRLFEPAVAGTAYPFLLFLSQAETERLLAVRLEAEGVEIERGCQLIDVEQDEQGVTAMVHTEDGGAEIRAKYVVGCDGAHSRVRHAIGIDFAGVRSDQEFLLADLEADGVDREKLHFFVSDRGPLILFPLRSPASFRLLTLAPPGTARDEVSLELLQGVVDAVPQARLRLHDPVWLTLFTISSRVADRFRVGRVFLAGDACHVHSPAGAQGMNTGIQDAVNLGWKLALVRNRQAGDALLDTYEEERMPVARDVVRVTHRAFGVATSRHPVLRAVRPWAAAAAVATLRRVPALRRLGFRALSELDIRYRRSSLSGSAPRGRGPRPGDRLPDTTVGVGRLQRQLSPASFTLLLCGPAGTWTADGVGREWSSLLSVVRLDTGAEAQAARRLGLGRRDTAALVVRPDGYVGYRGRGEDLSGVRAYLRGILR